MTAGARLQRFIRHMLARRAGVCLLPSPSFQRKLESSGLDHPFPHSGNDNHRDDRPARHSAKPAIPSLLDSSAACSRPACRRQAGMTTEVTGAGGQSSASPPAPGSRELWQTGKKNRPRGAVWVRFVTGGSGQDGFADQVLDIAGVGFAQFGDLLRVFHGRL